MIRAVESFDGLSNAGLGGCHGCRRRVIGTYRGAMKRVLTAHGIPVCLAVFLKRLTFLFESEVHSGQAGVFWRTRDGTHIRYLDSSSVNSRSTVLSI